MFLNKMHFESDQFHELLTPTIDSVGVNQNSYILSSNDLFPFDDNEVVFSSNPSEEKSCDLLTKDDTNKNGSTNDDFDYGLLPTFELPTLDEIDKAGKKSKVKFTCIVISYLST